MLQFYFNELNLISKILTMGKMKCKVVCLTTNDTVMNGIQIIKNNENNELRLPLTGVELRRLVAGSAVWKAQHLYLVSDEAIEVGDIWMKPTGKINISACSTVAFNNPEWLNSSDCVHIKKVVASTDTSLNLPSIPQSFLEKYVESNGSINEVEIEMTSSELEYVTSWDVAVNIWKEVIISQSKESWTRDEHCTDMYYYMQYCQSNGYVTPMEWLDNYKHY